MKVLSFIIAFLLISFADFSVFGQVSAGMIDLRELPDDFSSISLDGEWEFYWKEIIAPENFSDDGKRFVEFPKVWNNLNFEEELSGQGFATYRLTVLLNPSEDFAIYTPAVYSAYRFYVNGNLISFNGEVGEDENSTKSFWTQKTEVINQALLSDTNEFVLQIANFSTHLGGPVDSVILGRSEFMMNQIAKVRVIDAIISGALLMGGLFFLGLYLFGTSQRVVLYFSFFCLVFSYYNFTSGTYLLQYLFPHIPWQLSVRLEFGSLYLSAILLSLFTKTIYPKDTPQWFIKVALGIMALPLLMIGVTPVSWFTMLHGYWLMLILVIMVVGIYIYFRAAYFKRVGSAYSLIGGGFILVILIWRTLDVLTLVTMPFFVTPIGYVVFFFLHSLTLSQQFVISWKIAKEEAEKALKIKSDFLSTMSHEIRTPMNAVIGLTDYLLEDDPKEQQLENLRTLKFSAGNLLVIINDILDYSKIEANKIQLEEQWVRVGELVGQLKNIVKPLVGDKPIKLIMKADDDVPATIKCDVTRSVQVLTNLLNNAVKFTKSGSVSLTIHQLTKDKDHVRLLFQVMDTGIGIPQEKIDEIFESFTQVSGSTTREYGGTGLGLAISRRLLQIQGVDLKLKSTVGEGSTFFYEQTFQYKEEEAKTIIPDTFSDENELENTKVLLVEDNEVNVLVARKFLSKWGVMLTHAENGRVGYEKALEEGFDLILMDIQMPVMDGYEATRKIRESGIRVPIIALTASAFIHKQKNLQSLGIDDYVTKPFDPEELYLKIKKNVTEFKTASKN